MTAKKTTSETPWATSEAMYLAVLKLINEPGAELLFSPGLDHISAALNQLQSKLGIVAKSSKVNAGRIQYNYAQLSDVIHSGIQPHLEGTGLSYVQPLGNESIWTMLLHTSGQWICFRTPAVPENAGAKGIGSATSYMRRYSLTGAFGVPQADDDGMAADGHPGLQPRQAQPKKQEVWSGKIKRAKSLSTLRDLERQLKDARQAIISDHGDATWKKLRRSWGSKRDEIVGEMLKHAAPWFADDGPMTVDIPLVSEVIEFLEERFKGEELAEHALGKLGQADNPDGHGLFASLMDEVRFHRAPQNGGES